VEVVFEWYGKGTMPSLRVEVEPFRLFSLLISLLRLLGVCVLLLFGFAFWFCSLLLGLTEEE
jgi:hypothetical protein